MPSTRAPLSRPAAAPPSGADQARRARGTAGRLTGLGRAVAAGSVLLLMMAGVPLFLAALIGDPRPGWADLCAGDLSDTALLQALASVAWLAWGYGCLTVLTEAARLARERDRSFTAPAGQAPGSALARLLLTALVISLPLAVPIQARADTASVATGTIAALPARPGTDAAHLNASERVSPRAGGLIAAAGERDQATLGAVSARPAVRSPQAAADDGHLVYVVREGDRLGVIAQRFLGDFWAYGRIRKANAHLMPAGDGPQGADHIQIGWHLRLPAGARDRGARPHARGLLQERTVSAPHDQRPAPPSSSSLPHSVTGTPAPSSSLGAASPIPTVHARVSDADGVGITIPGGWLDLPLAAALAAAGAAVWLRRRMNYLYPPFEDGSSGEADDDLIPLPAAVTRIRRAVRAYGTALPVMLAGHRQRGDSQIDPGEAAPFGADPAAAGALDESAVGLIGPGAAAAARARLVAALAATGTSREAGVVVLPATTLQRLLPSWTPSGGGGHLEIGADLNDALARFEHHLRRRRTRLEPPQTPEVSSSQGAASGDPAARTAPGLLLITDLAPPAAHERLTQALRTAAGRGAGVVVLGELPGGGLTLTVERDGLTRARRPSNHPSRLAVLDEASTVAILQVLAEAHPAPVPTRDQETTAPPRPGSPPARSSLPASESPAAPAGTGPRVSIRVLGSPPVILDHEGLPVAGLRRHAAELLVYLAVHRTGAPLAQILEAVYPDATWKRAQQRLSTEAANLRRSIRTAAGAPDLQPVVNTGSRYHLDPAVLDIDLWQLVDQLDQLESATTDRAQPAHHLQAILAAADGALPGAEGGYDWIDAPREHLRRRIIRALLALADDPATTAPEAAALAGRAADLDCASEHVAQRAIAALGAVGNATAIGERMQRLRQGLQEIGEQPSAATLRLAAGLMSGPPATA